MTFYGVFPKGGKLSRTVKYEVYTEALEKPTNTINERTAFSSWHREYSDDNKTNHKTCFPIFSQNTLEEEMRTRSKWWVGEKSKKNETMFAFPLPVSKLSHSCTGSCISEAREEAALESSTCSQLITSFYSLPFALTSGLSRLSWTRSTCAHGP